MRVVELKTGLFPDASRVAEALETLDDDLARLDLSQLDPDDEAAWADVVSAVLGADLIVTL